MTIREIVVRASLLGDALVAIWDDGSGKAAAEIEALKVAGEVNPRTEIMLVSTTTPGESPRVVTY